MFILISCLRPCNFIKMNNHRIYLAIQKKHKYNYYVQRLNLMFSFNVYIYINFIDKKNYASFAI